MHVRSCCFNQSKPIAFLPLSLPSPSSLLKLPNMDLFTVSFNFRHGQVRGNRRHHWKSALILVKLPNLKVVRLNRAKIELRKVAKIYRHLYVGGQVCTPYIQTSVKIWTLNVLSHWLTAQRRFWFYGGMFGISGRSLRSRVGEVFASNVSLIAISLKICCSYHSCISNNFVFR